MPTVIPRRYSKLGGGVASRSGFLAGTPYQVYAPQYAVSEPDRRG